MPVNFNVLRPKPISSFVHHIYSRGWWNSYFSSTGKGKHETQVNLWEIKKSFTATLICWPWVEDGIPFTVQDNWYSLYLSWCPSPCYLGCVEWNHVWYIAQKETSMPKNQPKLWINLSWSAHVIRFDQDIEQSSAPRYCSESVLIHRHQPWYCFCVHNLTGFKYMCWVMYGQSCRTSGYKVNLSLIQLGLFDYSPISPYM